MTTFKTTDTMKEMMGAYYLGAKNAGDNGIPVAWITSGAPVEHLYAMGVIPIYPENYAAMCSVTRMSVDLMESAEARGYSTDVCSYARTDLGQIFTQGGPLMGLPEPQMLVVGNNICRTVIKWFSAVARHYQVPLFMIDMPYLHRGLEDELIDYLVQQFEGYEGFLADVLDRPFDRDRFLEVCLLSMEASIYWKKVLETAKNRPSPINSFDTFIHMAPIVTLRGTREGVEYYRQLTRELEGLVKEKTGSVPNERIRLLWDNLPIWYRIKYLSEVFGERGAAFVVSTYTNSWAAIDENTDVSNPYREIARAYLSPYINRDFSFRVEYLASLIEEFSLDGFVMHSDRSCKPYSLGQYVVKEKVEKISGRPGLVIEADMNDPRVFAEGPTRNRIEAYLESLS